MPSEYKRYNLTLTVVDQSQRDKFRKLSRPETFFEIRPNRDVGERGAYSVEMNEEEYREALWDAESPFSNLIDIQTDETGFPTLTAADIPGSTAADYLAMSNADSLGLDGSGITVGVIDTGLGFGLRDGIFAGRIKAAKAFDFPESTDPMEPYYDATGHGDYMASLAVPSNARLVVGAARAYAASTTSAALYWMVDEIGVNIVNMSFVYSLTTPQTIFQDAMNHTRAKNVLMFLSAGNNGANHPPEYPSGHTGGYVISAYDAATDTKRSDSNYGNHIWAASVGGPLNWANGDGVVEDSAGSGATSAASALASRIAALFMSGNVSAGNVIKYLESTARRTGASPIYEGHGVLQLAAAWNKLKDDQAPPTNTNGSIPLPNGGKVQLPAQSGTYVNPDLPINTTVYPTGEADFSTKAGSFILPEGGSAQLASGTALPDGWPATGDLPLSQNSQVTGPLPDGQTPGYCQENA